MYEMLTGEQPYTGETLGEIAVKHMNAEPVPPREKAPETPEELERICLRAMNASLEERYQTAGELYEDLEAFTQEQLKAEEEINPPVKPIRAPGEQSKKKYSQGRRRAGRVSFLAGTFGVLVTALALFIFLWNFWLGEIFSPAERIRMPNFVGSNYEALLGDSEIAGTYSFRVTFIVDPEAQPGIVLAQNPGEGRSIMITPDGVEVELTVSAGESTAGVPDVLNMDYRDAAAALRQAGFSVEIQNAISDSVAKDLVISTSPNAGEQLSTGSTVYIVVSSGTEISYVSMPNLVGLSEDAAISQLQNSGLVYGASVRETNDVDAGTVIGQSVEAFTDVEEHSKIVLTVSAGPEG